MDPAGLVADIVERVQRVEGVRAIVLGGSRARGNHSASSDIDLGIYYHPDRPMDLAALERVATEIDDRHTTGLLTPVGGWGPWINGGGWLTVSSYHVDFLYRDLRKVGNHVADCRRGIVEIAYQPGHPFGFLTAIYLAEVAVCRALWEADGELTTLKALAIPYPAALRKAVVDKFGWEVRFSLDIAAKAVELRDSMYAAGCCFRAVSCMLQVLFALNGEYWLNEKRAVAMADSFVICPADLRTRIEQAFASLKPESPALTSALIILSSLREDVERLAANIGEG